jgi:predicted MFS family arabinose efflux permease
VAVAFVALERRTRAPLVRFGILRSGMVLRSSLSAAMFSGAFMWFQYIVVLYLQQVRGWSPLETGLAMVIAGMDMILAPSVTPWLVKRYGLRRVITGGTMAAVLAYSLFLRIGPDSGYVTHILPTMILIAIAFAAAYGPLTIAATDGVSPEEQGLAGGVLYTAWQFGAAIGLAAVTSVLVSETATGGHVVSSVDEITQALAVPIGMALLSGLAIVVPGRRCLDCPESAVLARAGN